MLPLCRKTHEQRNLGDARYSQLNPPSALMRENWVRQTTTCGLPLRPAAAALARPAARLPRRRCRPPFWGFQRRREAAAAQWRPVGGRARGARPGGGSGGDTPPAAGGTSRPPLPRAAGAGEGPDWVGTARASLRGRSFLRLLISET